MSALQALFSGANAVNAAEYPQQQPQQTQQVQLVQTPAAQQEPEPQGLDKFKTLTEPIDPKTLPEQFDPTKLFDTNPENLRGAIDKLDFASAVSQEDMQAIVAGGEGAVKAFANAMNAVSRNIFYNSTLASTKLVEQGITKSLPAVDTKVRSTLRENEIRSALASSDPIFSKPEAKVILEPLQNQLMQKFPNASPGEIVAMAKDYMKAFAETVNPAPKTSTPEDNTNWGSYL